MLPPVGWDRGAARASNDADGWDRDRARPAVGEGFPVLLFRLQGGFTVSPSFGIGPHPDRSLFVTPARQGRKALLGENLAHRGCAQRRALLLESLADLVDRVIPLAQRHDLLVGTALLGLLARPGASGCEEFWQLAAATRVAQHTECARRVAEALCRLRRRQFLHEEGAQSLILALARRRWLLEEAATVR